MRTGGPRSLLCFAVWSVATVLAVFSACTVYSGLHHQLQKLLSTNARERSPHWQLRTAPKLFASQTTILPHAQPFRSPADYQGFVFFSSVGNASATPAQPSLPDAAETYMSTQAVLHAQLFAAPGDGGVPPALTTRLVRETSDVPHPTSHVPAAFAHVYVLTQPGRTRQQTLAHHTLRALGLSYTMCYTIPPPPAAVEALLSAADAATQTSIYVTADAVAARQQTAGNQLRGAASHLWLLSRIASSAVHGTDAADATSWERRVGRTSLPTTRHTLHASSLVLTDTALLNPAAFAAELAALQRDRQQQVGDGGGLDDIRNADILLFGRSASGLAAENTSDAALSAAYAVSPQAASRLAAAIPLLLSHFVATGVRVDPVLAAVTFITATRSHEPAPAPLTAVRWPLVDVLAPLEATIYAVGPPGEDTVLAEALVLIGADGGLFAAQRQALLSDLGLLSTMPSDASATTSHGSSEGGHAASTIARAPVSRDVAVCIAFFNPARAERLLALLLEMVARYAADGAPVFIMELVYDDEVPQLQSLEGATVFNVRSHSVMFHKENLWNLLAARVPPQYPKLLFLDANVLFFEPYWYEAISRALDAHPVVQPFHSVMHTTADRASVIRFHPGLVVAHATVGRARVFQSGTAPKPVAGFGIAVQRSWLAEVGGFMDMAVLGGGDYLLGAALYGRNISQNRPLTLQPYAHAAQAAFIRSIEAASQRRRARRQALSTEVEAATNTESSAALTANTRSNSTTNIRSASKCDIAAAARGPAFEWTPGASIAWDKFRPSSRCGEEATARTSDAAESDIAVPTASADAPDGGVAADTGWAPVTAEHLFHGSLGKRQYGTRYERTQALRAEDFWRNADGVIEFVDAETWNPITRAYFAARGEDE